MNFKNLTLAAMAILLTVIMGCKKDSNNDTPTNSGQFTYDGTSYTLSQGCLIGFGSSNSTSYGLELLLMSSGLNIVETGGTADSINGTGDIFALALYSSSQTVLEPGNYSFSSSEASGTIEDGILLIQYKALTDESQKEDYFVEGTLTVTKAGDQYELTFNMTNSLEKTTTGSFKGKLKYYSEYNKKTLSLK